MPSWFVRVVLSVALLASFAGCSTAPRGKAGLSRTNAPAGVAKVRLESPEDLERRAEAHARFLAGLTYDLNQDVERASEQYEKSLAADPANEGLALDLSRRFLQQKQFDRALDALKKASEAPDATAMVFARIGFVHLQQGDTNAAVEANRKAIKRQPGSMVGYQSLYSLHRQAGQTNEARKILEQAARQQNVDAAFLVDLATLYFMEDASGLKGTNALSSTRARDALDRAAGQSPTNFLVLQKLAQGFRMLGDAKKSAEVYLKLLEQFPELPGVREELAEIYLRSNDTKRAAEQLETIIRDSPTNPQAYYFLGAIAYDQKRYADAVDNYRKALLLNPAFEQVYYDIAAAKIAQDQAREALDYLEQAKRRFKQTFVGEFFSGVAYMRLKQYTNALDHFTAAEVVGKATDTNRLTHTFYFQLGSAYERAGDIGQAVSYFEKSIEMSPKFSEALNYLGYMWAERGTNLDRARKMIEQAVSLDPTNAAYLDSLGWVLFKQGHAKEALPQIEKAVELSETPDATLYDHLGDIHAALGQSDKAREAWRKSLEVEANKDIQKKLEADDAAKRPKPKD